ncbi:baculoviral IAP repeat-containing protein 7 [Rhineura floridana]|uniref:baculoviral IAP repeat-containing protein 7 n=1 Tax=Rhineura floridana TaxID=261503 RepID=UPI002AC800FA|nr:baculoviral IAP repeat-containing protein 7 [Rhineura floridana]XP_061487000.1 baculoviral IAP repeat-containing protein 7 [Rhineura floridana]XP_061487001.1 baculoviral IAP repeat-containing protein 7 [Rhineura floridana]XP_061487002.1 baculoviral IAP repeat-containing protein 7 [Rhineura floridana]
MEAADVRELFIATGARLVADVLTNLFSRNWEMGDSSSPEAARNRHFRLSQSNMRSEERRLRTFQHWADIAPTSPADLAAAGFFFIGPDDRVKCFCCGGVLYDWFAEDDPMAEHKKFFPVCPFIQGKEVGNQQRSPAEDAQDIVEGQFLGMLQSLSMEEAITGSQPEYPDMEAEEDRLLTFENWPSYAQVIPELLASAGFFYTGQEDYVKCFYCDGTLRSWEHGDDPLMEHARWFPRCQFLLQSRGRDFINSIQEPYISNPVSSEDNLYWPEQHLPSSQEPAQRQTESWRMRRETKYPNEPESALSVEEQLRRLQEERTCKVCMDKDVSIVLVPCGHLVVCAECAPNLRRCPICRGVIRESMKAFLS